MLALALFGHAATCWSGFSEAAAAAASHCSAGSTAPQQQQAVVLLPPGHVAGVLLPAPFLQQFRFPFRVQPVATDSDSTAAADDDGSDAPSAAKQQLRVRQLLEQQQLLQHAGGDAVAARALLQDCMPPELAHISGRVLSVTANQLINTDAGAVAQHLLAAVAASSSHAECEAALRQLQQLGSSTAGLAAIAAAAAAPPGSCSEGAGAAWQVALQRLLAAAPVTHEDQRLWLQVLQLLERMLLAAPLTEVRPCACCLLD